MKTFIRFTAALLLLSWVGGCTIGKYINSSNVLSGGSHSAIMLFLLYIFFNEELND